MNLEPMAARMTRKLTQAFAPISLEIDDESARHAGHAGHKAGGESHFKIKIVSAAFNGLSPVARHRAIYAALAEEMGAGGVHALAIEACGTM